MTAGVTIWRCSACRAGFFPQPLLCRRCGGASFDVDRMHEGAVEEVSVIRHMLGQENWQPRRIASVRLPEGQRITVGLRDELEPGAAVDLFEEDGALFGQAKAAGSR